MVKYHREPNLSAIRLYLPTISFEKTCIIIIDDKTPQKSYTYEYFTKNPLAYTIFNTLYRGLKNFIKCTTSLLSQKITLKTNTQETRVLVPN